MPRIKSFRKIGIIGCGTIGSALAKAIRRQFARHASVAYLCDHSPEKSARLKSLLGPSVLVTDLQTLIRKSDLIIEAASTRVVPGALAWILQYHKEALIMSVGGLLNAKAATLLKKDHDAKIWVPSGALAGVDALLAASESKIKSVKLVTRKPPQGLNTAPYFKTHPFPQLKGKKEYCVFQATASQAVKSFPQNINVAAVLSLAGIGEAKTKVEIWTSKAYRFNQHEVTVESASGKIQTVTQNVPSRENPKTSALAIYSAIATLRRIFSTVRIGT